METPLYSTNCNVYQPSEDTFLFLDSLEKDLSFIKSKKPTIILEVGIGSGILLTALCKHIGPSNAFYLGTDVNQEAGYACLEAFSLNHLPCRPQIIVTNLLDGLVTRLAGQVDLVIFNPPYVPTDDQEVNDAGDMLTRSWAGGANGRRVIDQFLEVVPKILAIGGLLYLLLIKQNQPDQVINILKENDIMFDKIIFERQCRNEHLMVLRFSKH